jgi:hypothetical protein
MNQATWVNFLIIGLMLGFVGGSFMAAWRRGKPPPEYMRTHRIGPPWRPSALKWGVTWSAIFGVFIPVSFLLGGPTAATVVTVVLVVTLVMVVVSAEERHWRP